MQSQEPNYFSSLDITSAYNQIPIKTEDIPKTAFVTKYGLFENTTMPFGLCNAPHITRLKSVFRRIREANLKLKPTKCHLLKTEVIFLGHKLTPDGIQPNPENVERILQRNPPHNMKEVQSFLGMTNYYRRFIRNYSELVRPLINLTKKGVPFHWDDTCQQVFEKVKVLLVHPPIMAHPQNKGDYILDTDACNYSL